jgi:uncharacterized protein (TIGR02246 family)
MIATENVKTLSYLMRIGERGEERDDGMTIFQQEEDEAAVHRLLAQWAQAMRSGNVEAASALVTDDAEFWSNGTAPLLGREAVRTALSGVLLHFRLEQDFEERDFVVRGDLGFIRGIEHNVLRPRNGGPPIARHQQAFSIVRRDAEGSWRFWRGMTSFPPQH